MSDALPFTGLSAYGGESVSLRPGSRAVAVAAGRRAALALAGVALVVAMWWLISLGSVAVRVPSPASVF